MFRRILLPVDLTDRHQRSLEMAARLARHEAGEVVLVHVIEVIHGLTPDEDRDFYGRLEKNARQHLEILGQFLTQQSVPWSVRVLYGDRAEQIIHCAEEEHADLILMTSHRIDLTGPIAGWGTLSYKIGILSQCPVLLVK
ncbi:MAG: universal stress protein [Gemmataceae bacterium]